MRIRWPSAAVVVAVVAASAVAVADGEASGSQPARRPAWTFGAFAGYQWFGRVTEISARWVVPQMESSARRGAASTWIGAEAPGRIDKAPFIQVGTQEEARARSYGAFWSDTRQGFHPRLLFKVAAGDTIAASLELSSGHWAVAIADVTSGAKDSFVTRDEARGAFNDAQWLQEDETDLATGRPLPYPQLAPTRFISFAVNGSVPEPARLSRRWLSLPRHRALGPERTGDSFAVRPMQLSADAEQFLLLAVPYKSAAAAFRRELRGWGALTSARQKRADAARLVRAARAFIGGITAARWPPRARAAVARLVGALRQQVIAAQPEMLPKPTDIAVWRQAWNRDDEVVRAATAIRRLLNVPRGDKESSS
jgi:hypothetical protein